MFVGIGTLSNTTYKLFCILFMITLHDRVKNILKWSNDTKIQSYHVVQTIDNKFYISKVMEKSILLLDRHFLSVNALCRLNELNADNHVTINIVIKAKKSCISYSPNFNQKSGRGNLIKEESQ